MLAVTGISLAQRLASRQTTHGRGYLMEKNLPTQMYTMSTGHAERSSLLERVDNGKLAIISEK